MVWPGVSDYQEAIQGPQHCFQDPDLKAGAPVLTPLGLPRPISGGNASVYQIRSGKNEWAVRCFLRNIPDLQQRYAAIDAHLRGSSLSARVGFHYLVDGVRVRGAWYPVLKMEWVRGVPINDHIAGIVADRKELRRLADDWQRLCVELEQQKIAHGDLQHGNVLVSKGRLVLIDYDGMCVPALAGNPSHELGHPSFQHPGRDREHFGMAMDRFAALVFHTAILALSCDQGLWDRYDNGDNLLFTRQDFAEPDASPLFAELERLADEDVRLRARALRRACASAVVDTPRLADAVAYGRSAPVTTPASNAAATTAAAAPASAPRRPAALAAGGGSGARTGGANSWLPSLMGTTPGAPAGAGGSFSLGQLWKVAGPSNTRVARVTAAANGQDGRQRIIVVGVLAGLLAVATTLFSTPLAILVALAGGGAVWSMIARLRAALAAARETEEPGVATPRFAFAADGRTVAVAGIGGTNVHDAHGGKVAARLGNWEQCLVGVMTLGGGRFGTAGREGTIRVFDAAGAVMRSWRDGRLLCAAGSHDGKRIAAAVAGKTVRVWGQDGALQSTLRGHRGEATALAFAHDQDALVTGSADHEVRIWSLPDGNCQHVLAGLGEVVSAVAISDNGRFVAAAARTGRVCIWDGKRQKLLHTIETGAQGARSLAFTPDGAQLLVGCADRSLQCVDAIAGTALGQVKGGHGDAVVAVAVSPDGRTVLTGDAAGVVVAWQRRVRAPATRGSRRVQTAAP